MDEVLAALLAAARPGALLRAVEQLSVAHGTVSRRIYALELWLGVAIFERDG